jgi:hypothetical protein
MTLQDFFNWIGNNPTFVLYVFICLPLIAFIIGYMSGQDGNNSPWKYLYAAIIYVICIPGIFAMTLNVYLFLFERKSVFEANVYTQILPIVSMFASLVIIRSKVNLDLIPGFDKLSGLVMMITCAICFMWFLDRTHIYVFSFMPFWQVAGILLALILLMRLGWKNFVSK